MTDRECLLIAYGALKVNGPKSVVEIVEAHLFKKAMLGAQETKTYLERIGTNLKFGMKEEPPVVLKTPDLNVGTFKVTQDIAHYMPVEERPATPGDYRLKRHILGTTDCRLSGLDKKSLKDTVKKYRAEISRGCLLHPNALEDIEAAELYLKSDSEQEYKKGST